MPDSAIKRIVELRRRMREAAALAAGSRALSVLVGMGVRAKLTGSLGRGTFDLASDVDLLIIESPPELRYAVEARVEDVTDAMPFHVIYLDEVKSENARQRFLRDAVDAPAAP